MNNITQLLKKVEIHREMADFKMASKMLMRIDTSLIDDDDKEKYLKIYELINKKDPLVRELKINKKLKEAIKESK